MYKLYVFDNLNLSAKYSLSIRRRDADNSSFVFFSSFVFLSVPSRPVPSLPRFLSRTSRCVALQALHVHVFIASRKLRCSFWLRSSDFNLFSFSRVRPLHLRHKLEKQRNRSGWQKETARERRRKNRKRIKYNGRWCNMSANATLLCSAVADRVYGN